MGLMGDSVANDIMSPRKALFHSTKREVQDDVVFYSYAIDQ